MANALAYYDTATITAVKSFIVQATKVAYLRQKRFIILDLGENVVTLCDVIYVAISISPCDFD